MEISGVNRLLSLARELGVQATRDAERPPASRIEADEIRTANPHDEGGVRVSLSAAATGAAGPPPPTPTVETRPPAPQPTESDLSASRTGQGSRRGNAAIAAYQRNAASLPGERFEVRA